MYLKNKITVDYEMKWKFIYNQWKYDILSNPKRISHASVD